jgi:2-methylcitrate dehydratase PrpD
MTVTQRLADHVASLRFEDVPPAAVSMTKALILDALGCAFGGGQSPLGRLLAELARDASEGQHTLIGFPWRTSLLEAAFVNAGVINALDYDDTSDIGHPGSTVVAAALAVGEAVGASGQSLLTAVAAGVQAATRIARAIQPSWDRYVQVHSIGCPQVFGAAAAASVLLKLDAARTADTFGIAGPFAPVAHAGKFGWDERRVSWVKDNVSRAADGGVRAALLAARGFPGNRTILDGERGFWVMAGSDQFDPTHLVEGLDRYDVMDLSFKPYPCCRWIHTTLDAVGEIVERERLSAGNVESVDVHTIAALATTFTDPTPATLVDAQFSVPYCVAVRLLGVPRARWPHDAVLTDPEVLALARRVRVHLDAEAQSDYLRSGRLSWAVPTRVSILAGGRCVDAHARVASGSPERPLSDAALEGKFHELADPVVGERRAQEISELVAKLDTLDRVSHLTELLRTG